MQTNAINSETSAAEKIKDIITDSEKNGAKLLLDGRKFAPKGYEKGFWVGPTIIDNLDYNMRAYVEEIFGPVLDLFDISSLEEGIDIINKNNPYGNGSAIFTSSGYFRRQFFTNVRVGMIGVNVPIPVPVAYHSFGGWEDSLVGESHIYGPESVKFYTKAKVISERWTEQDSSEKSSFHFSGASGS